jgi:hypothetical protein
MHSINQTLRQITIKGQPITIKVISDDQPEMELAYKLWYQVYIEELGYKLVEGVDHEKKTLSLKPNGSLVFLGLDDSNCLATVRTTHQNIPLEFDYSQADILRPAIEVTKLIAAKGIRHSTSIASYVMIETQKKNIELYSNYTIVINSAVKMLPFYYLIGFDKISDKIIHPTIKNESYLMACSKQKFGEVCSDLEKIANGNQLVKAKWGLKHWWYKNFNNN